jgi:hypothetical protein
VITINLLVITKRLSEVQYFELLSNLLVVTKIHSKIYRHEVQLHYTLVHHRTQALIVFGTALCVLTSTTVCYALRVAALIYM